MTYARKTVRLGKGRRRRNYKGGSTKHYNGRRYGGSPFFFTLIARGVKGFMGHGSRKSVRKHRGIVR